MVNEGKKKHIKLKNELHLLRMLQVGKFVKVKIRKGVETLFKVLHKMYYKD